MKRYLLFSLIFSILILSIFSVSLAAAAGSECNLWCKIVYLFTGKIQPTGNAVAEQDNDCGLLCKILRFITGNIVGITEGPYGTYGGYGGGYGGYGGGYGGYCGDGNVGPGEECDDGATQTPVTCGVGACERNVPDICLNCLTIICVPGDSSTEICNDVIDNDCDGLTDCDDSDCSSAPNCAQQCPPGMKGYWRAEGNALDSFDANHGTAQGGATYAAGKIGQAFSFGNSPLQYVEIPHSNSLNLDGNLSLEAWINWNGENPNDYTLISKDVSLPSYSVQLRPHHSWIDFAYTTQSGFIQIIRFNYGIPGNQWAHIVVTFDYNSHQAFLYANNQKIALGEIFYYDNGWVYAWVNSPPQENTLPVTIGNSFPGLIDEVAVYKRVLTDAEVEYHYNSGNGRVYCAAMGPVCTDADLDGWNSTADCNFNGVADCNDTNPAVNPTADDAICDGIDNDCNGVIDQYYDPYPTTCGSGVCEAHGFELCVNGQIIDTCPSTCNDTDKDGWPDRCVGYTNQSGGSYGSYGSYGGGSYGGYGGGYGAGAEYYAAGYGFGQYYNLTEPVGSPTFWEAITKYYMDVYNFFGSLLGFRVTGSSSGGYGGYGGGGYGAYGAAYGFGFGYEYCAVDCNDNDVNVHPLASDVCDTKDNDCDGQIDEDYTPVPTSCGTGECLRTGQWICLNGYDYKNCTAGDPNPYELCEIGMDVDDNCDGSVNEDCNCTEGDSHNCGSDVGECNHGTQTCDINGEWSVCNDIGPADEICDGLDNNCEGNVDEGGVCPTLTYYCDNDGDTYLSSASSGTCNTYNCVPSGCSTSAGNDCNDADINVHPGASDANCNNVDDNCNGLVDEGYVSTQTTCGIGACASTGQTYCAGGVVQDSCTEGIPAADDSICNGIDDDCDTFTDEDYVSQSTECGIGACHAFGATSCVNGGVEDSCTPGSPGANDATCNGIDDNCNGPIDENYAPYSTSCGVGACAATGMTSCVGGTEQDSCTPGASSSEICDGIDNDCDGSTDEDFLDKGQACTNGLGVCKADGFRVCSVYGNETVCDAVTGQPTGTDENCNGVDENCNGLNDDNYTAPVTQCGITECMAESWHGDCYDDTINLCYAEGALSCIGGQTYDTCVYNDKEIVYQNADGDDYGNGNVTLNVCTIPSGYIRTDFDCNDADNMTNPGADDICNADHIVVNKDCNASNDGDELNCQEFCGDIDMDGYVTPEKWGEWNGIIPSIICPWIKGNGDCNDGNAQINPEAVEVCDGVDNNCINGIDEGCSARDKTDALAILQALYSSDSKSQKELSDGIKELKKSLGNLDPDGDKNIIWIDSNHIACRHGHKVFDHEKKAVEHLQKVTDTSIKGQVQMAINSIVAADRLLALTAINEAPAGKDKNKAIEHFNKGEAATDNKKKIQEYRKAWKQLNKDCEKKGKVSCIDAISVLSPMGDTVTAIGDEVGHPETVFEDIYENKIAIHTSCSRCLYVGQVISGWTITEIVNDDGALALKCAKK